MLKHVTLRNYRQHRELTIHFGPGLNAIRGANEAGKTTILEAIVYAWFGARALSEPLEDIVTYGLAPTKLRVELAFEFLGVEYSLYRAKSGCELSFGDQLVTGQTEVTKYMESLFKVNAEMAGRLMLAEQTDLRGILNSGATAAGKMMEYLANFDLLDRVIELVQTRLPAGNTDVLESRIGEMEARLAEPVVEQDIPHLEDGVIVAQGAVGVAQERVYQLQDELKRLDIPAAQSVLARRASLIEQITKVKAQQEQVQVLLARPALSPVDATKLAALRTAVEEEKQVGAALALLAKLRATDTKVRWDEPYTVLVTAIEAEGELIAARQAQLVKLNDDMANARTALAALDKEYQVSLTRLQGQLIKETTCSLCLKDLSDVPEVVQINSALQADIQSLTAQMSGQIADRQQDYDAKSTESARLNKEITERQDTLRQLLAVQQYNGTVEALYAKAEQYITLDRNVVPAQWTWIGPAEGDRPDVAAQLVLLENEDRAYVADAAQRTTRKEQLAELTDQLHNARHMLSNVEKDVQVAEAEISRNNELVALIQGAQDVLAGYQATLQQAETALATAKALAEQAARQRQLLEDQVKQARLDLTEMQTNNALIKKVRGARPVITTKLWNLVLAAVSKDFTKIRGEETTITRDGDRFMYNGHPVAGLSGSAKDSLGLAMRIGLVKTFIPNVGFMSLDEPAAACSDEREVSMLGALATSGFDQILLVTHSDLADSFASHMINI